MDEPCVSFIEPAPKVDLLQFDVSTADGYLAYLAALPFPPPHPRPALPPSKYDARNPWGPLQDDPLWISGEYQTHDVFGREVTVGGLSGEW